MPFHLLISNTLDNSFFALMYCGCPGSPHKNPSSTYKSNIATTLDLVADLSLDFGSRSVRRNMARAHFSSSKPILITRTRALRYHNLGASVSPSVPFLSSPTEHMVWSLAYLRWLVIRFWVLERVFYASFLLLLRKQS